MDANQKFQKIIRSLIRRAAEAEIVSEIPLEPEQLAALQNLNRYCVNQVLNDTEVVYDPRKINYKSNQELKAALVALLLSRALTDRPAVALKTKSILPKTLPFTCRENKPRFWVSANFRLIRFRKVFIPK